MVIIKTPGEPTFHGDATRRQVRSRCARPAPSHDLSPRGKLLARRAAPKWARTGAVDAGVEAVGHALGQEVHLEAEVSVAAHQVELR